MPDYISRERLKKKVLDRWENEGGKILPDQAEISESGTPEKSGRRRRRTDIRTPVVRQIKKETSRLEQNENTAAAK